MDLEELIAKSAPLFRAKGAERVYLFGSRACGDADPRSDIDLLVVDDDDLPYLRRLDKYFDGLCEIVKGGIDLFVLRPSELDRSRELPFYRNALRGARVIYERKQEPT